MHSKCSEFNIKGSYTAWLLYVDFYDIRFKIMHARCWEYFERTRARYQLRGMNIQVRFLNLASPWICTNVLCLSLLKYSGLVSNVKHHIRKLKILFCTIWDMSWERWHKLFSSPQRRFKADYLLDYQSILSVKGFPTHKYFCRLNLLFMLSYAELFVRSCIILRQRKWLNQEYI